jgi:hypothetical protein
MIKSNGKKHMESVEEKGGSLHVRNNHQKQSGANFQNERSI